MATESKIKGDDKKGGTEFKSAGRLSQTLKIKKDELKVLETEESDEDVSLRNFKIITENEDPLESLDVIEEQPDQEKFFKH